MTVFNTFLKVFKKNIPNSIIYVVIFTIICIIFSNIGGNSSDEYKLSSCNIAVFDMDESEASKQLIEYLDTVHTLKFDYKNDEEYLLDRLYYMEIDYVLFIEKGYSETGKLSNMKKPGTNKGGYIDNQIYNYQKTMAAAKEAGYDSKEAYDLTLKALDGKEVVTVKSKSDKGSFNLISFYYNYESYVILMIMLFVMTPIFITFNSKELKERTDVSSFGSRKKNFQVFSGAVMVSLFIWAFFIILSLFMQKGHFERTDILANVNALVFTLVSAGIVNILGCFILKNGLMNVVNNIIGLAMAFLGGIFVPIQFFGKTMITIAKFMPTYWYVMANDSIFDGASVGKITKYMGVELLFAVAFFAISLVTSKYVKSTRTA